MKTVWTHKVGTNSLIIDPYVFVNEQRMTGFVYVMDIHRYNSPETQYKSKHKAFSSKPQSSVYMVRMNASTTAFLLGEGLLASKAIYCLLDERRGGEETSQNPPEAARRTRADATDKASRPHLRRRRKLQESRRGKAFLPLLVRTTETVDVSFFGTQG